MKKSMCVQVDVVNNEGKYIIESRNVTKVYPGVVALDNVSIGFYEGEVHAIVGENGAGKSTLIKIFSGAIAPSSGEIFFNGDKLVNISPHIAFDKGIGVIYQEFNLFPELTIEENLFMGRELKRGLMVKQKEMKLLTKEYLLNLGLTLDPNIKIKNLSVAYQQLIEICKVLLTKAKVIIMDEPTAPLTTNETQYLFTLIKKLKNSGVCVIYITHRFEEIFQIADRVSVFRDGQYIGIKNVCDTNKNELISLMVGRKIEEIYPVKKNSPQEVILCIKNLSAKELFENVTFELRKSEILGIFGLVGAGRTELARGIFGAEKVSSGEIIYKNKKIVIRSPKDSIKFGIGLIPEDRKKQGLNLKDSVKNNITIASIKKYCNGLLINNKKENKEVHNYREKLEIKTPSIIQKVEELSGGNQQKVVVAKWLATNSDIFIFDEPTRGIDINAKHEIYKLMCALVESGKSIIMISSEMPELIGMADRFIVMHEGKVVGELSKEKCSQENLLSLAVGNKHRGMEK